MMRMTISTTGAEMQLTLEADSAADFGDALGMVLDRADEFRPLLLALDGNSDGEDDTDGDDDGGNLGDNPGGEAVDVADRLLSGMGITG